MGRIRAFTLLEMLVVLGLVVLLIGLLVPTLNAVQSSSRRAREISGVPQLMVSYVGYATDNRGVLLPGYYEAGGLPIADEAGNDLSDLPGPVAARYPWRLAPYLSFELRGLYLDERVLEAMDDEAQKPYLVSLYPSFGLNTTFVGGDSDWYGFDPDVELVFGKFYVTRLSEPKDPAGLLTFASSRATHGGLLGEVDIVEGFHRVRPPYLVNRQWETGPYRPDADPDWPEGVDFAGAFGNVSMRDFGVAIVSFCDGHTGTLDPGRIEDMSLWCDQATTPDWRLQPLAP